MTKSFSDLELEAYLDEALTVTEMAVLEEAMRQDATLAERLATINLRRDAGVHTLGEIWRRHHVSCPTREQLGSYLLDVLPSAQSDYVRFHIDQVGCRFCAANLEDLKRLQEETAEIVAVRRTRYFQSSAGYLRSPRGKGEG